MDPEAHQKCKLARKLFFFLFFLLKLSASRNRKKLHRFCYQYKNRKPEHRKSKKEKEKRKKMSVVLVSSASATIARAKPTNSSSQLPTNSAKLPCGVRISPSKSKLLNSPLRVAAPPSVPTSDPAEEYRTAGDEEEEYGRESEEEGSKFSWRDHWYPVSLVEDLDPNLPTRFQLLGRDLVLWFDRNDRKWTVFDDMCPHRLAPLSEGRIDENGHLQCSYHGWSFDGCGSCTRIPQAASTGPEARAVKSPRACATKFPTMVSQGLLFVWPDENGWERANATEPPR